MATQDYGGFWLIYSVRLSIKCVYQLSALPSQERLSKKNTSITSGFALLRMCLSADNDDRHSYIAS